MLKVMIVEDDVMYRYALKTVINWEQYGFIIRDEAINGKDAINKLHVNIPDVLITDISMPELNGISLIKYVKENYPDIKILVLSSYDDYKFVRDALLLGAMDYILKYDLEKEKLVDLLDKIKDEIEKDRYNKILLKENKIMNDIISGNEIKDIKKELQGISKEFHPGVMLCVKIKELEAKEYDNNSLFHNIIDEKNSKYILGINKNLCCILLDISDMKSEFKIHNYLQDLSRYIIEKSYEYGIRNCQIGISDIFNDINRYEYYFKQAAISLEYSFYDKNKKIFFYSNDLIANKNQKLDDLLNHLRESTISGDVDKVKKDITNIFGFICKYKLSKRELKKVLLDLYIMYNNISRELQQDINDKLGVIELLVNDQINDVTMLEEEYLHSYSELCKTVGNKQYSMGIQRIVGYIEKNYRSSNLTVDKIAHIHDITPNYLSLIFKKETGIKITDYINALKIKEAKRLLRSSNKKVYEIAYDVGFNNVTYFCTIFKRKCGLTVKEYMNNGRKSTGNCLKEV
ncbi:hypothetical protein SH1V18_13990 [Vallitalea longa]|uniref:Stage 0 sporulation protein A homolog n=1 Tax=Vallitalea longa TaxID=2936439 RepID=A0A9W5Y9A5_9FIRM|nr:response regulator [Vallitalea longa]GKX28919.1 hypothetical protein SH1V18_13990 [Vallitalea longa]